MGLDITAYRKLTEVRPRKDVDDDGYSENLVSFYSYEDEFPGRFEGLKERTLYAYQESYDFRAGSYSGYGWWREELAKLAGYPAVPATRDGNVIEKRHAAACWQGAIGPFSELINFADNEGTISSVVAAKLAKDFAQGEERAKAHAHPWFYEQYQKWRKAMEMAADGGAVAFH